jgi:hypothetical protein
MHECEYCGKTFALLQNMKRHVKSSIQCINGRSIPKESVENLTCMCGFTTSRQDNFMRHQSLCQILSLTHKLTESQEQLKLCYNTIATDSKTIAKLEEQVKLLMTRPINVNNHNTTNNSGHTYNMSYYKQHIQDNFESITQPLLQGVMNRITLGDISYGGSGLAKFVKKHLDHQHLLILDQARRKGAYKDAKGQVVVDAKLRTLLQMIGEAAYPPAKKIFIDWNAENPDGFLDTGKSKILTSLLGSTAWLNRVGQGKTHEDDSEILSSFVDELASGYTKEALHNHLDREAAPPLIDTDDDDSEPEVSAAPAEAPVECGIEILLVEGSGDESDVSSDWPETDEDPDSDDGYSVYDLAKEYETEVETVSVTSSEFDVLIGTKNYENSRDRGRSDKENDWIEFKKYSGENRIEKSG